MKWLEGITDAMAMNVGKLREMVRDREAWCAAALESWSRARAVKNPPDNAGDPRDTGLIPGLDDPWRRKGQPTPVFLPGEFHGQRSLVGCHLWGCTELDTTEAT